MSVDVVLVSPVVVLVGSNAVVVCADDTWSALAIVVPAAPKTKKLAKVADATLTVFFIFYILL